LHSIIIIYLIHIDVNGPFDINRHFAYLSTAADEYTDDLTRVSGDKLFVKSKINAGTFFCFDLLGSDFDNTINTGNFLELVTNSKTNK
jgi:hypothetical protein